MSLSYFDYILAHLRQKVRLKPDLSRKFLSTLGPNPTRKARPNLQLWHWKLSLFFGEHDVMVVRLRIVGYFHKKTLQIRWAV